jgi:DNA-binding SARP family transcriptional activator
MAINGVGPELDGQYKTALRLLKQLQVDYRLTRKELDDVSLHFKEREAIAGKHLHTALNAIDMTRIDSESTMASERRDPPLEQDLATQRLAPHLAKQQFVPRLEAYYLGRFQVCVDWKRIDHWHSTKAKSVLKYLLAQKGRPVSKDVLMEAIWPGGELVRR